MVSASCINSLNPKIPEISLPSFSVSVGPILGLHGRVFCVPEQFGAPSPVAFGFIQDPFTAFSTSWSVGCSRHSLSPDSGRLIDRQLFLSTVPRPRLSVPEIISEGGQQVPPSLHHCAASFSLALSERKIFFNPCLICPIQDRSFREMTFSFRAFRCE